MKNVTKEMLPALNAQILSFERDRDKTFEFMLQFSAHEGVCEERFTMTAPAPFTNIQGGCNDGRYHYQAFNRSERTEQGFVDRESVIVKFDLQSGERVAQSQSYEFNHANDITYHPAKHQLILVHKRPYRNKLSIIDPDTLQLIQSITLERDVFSIAYNPLRDCYAVGKSGGQDFAILDADFKPIADHTAFSTRFTTQGMTCDDSFLYFLQHNKHCIMKYDWDGNFAEFIPLSQKRHEPENISFADGRLLVCYGASGGFAHLYEVTLKQII